ncbi:flagellar basal body rod protein FlgB [Grimontia hollisae]|uniref:Flagellar basal body rod protein FlgB n=2 Tax=Grimontia hollisae TaxID=673 RepID=D0ICC6_GRIHO|nr:flagellar basal body rod protein FlgB [Grimontia hollisae]EEY71544.1 flagellar basal-body rod protein FlgB [Grimontia hollisae CIP 101886]MDF2185583.1 flagellar basal body rod protein FlgB [Grimontia hollisae]STO43060.1 Putative proximal rod protein [Grimontia hollisae]STO56780.1 Putative proximal rod protein [Grimontia hollisae]STQ74636.1 Putative proximal rod protein [Grimontia hollisae]
MAITFDKALGVHQHTVGVRAQRAETLASNLANANTPGYKAQDVDFEQALQAATSGANFGLSRTNERHIPASSQITGQKMYRIPNQPDTGDGNTVDAQVERNLFMQNALEYQASLDFLGSKFKNMSKALKGE